MIGNPAPYLAQNGRNLQMTLSLRPLVLTALMTLPVIGLAHAQNWRDLHDELRQDRRDYRQAVKSGDWRTANQKARELRHDEYRLQRNGYNSGWNNGWNNNNGYYLRTTPYNNGYYYRYNTNPYYRAYP